MNIYYSSGEIKLWQIIENKQKLKEVATTNIGCRPTCISILDLEQFGANYVISSTIGAKEAEIKPTTSKAKAPQRGVVTIEYENGEEDSDEDDDSDNDKGEDTENEADSVAEEDYDVDSKDDGIEEDDDEEDDNEDSIEEDSDDSNPEPEIRLPKSRKHKLQIVKQKDDEKKKQKLDNSKSKQQFSKKQHPKQSQLNKSKLKFKK